MEQSPETNSLLASLHEKFEAIDQKTNTHLEGLLWSNPITYWDYIQTDVLLNIQNQRTVLPDEMVFILYHQVNELLFKMILWEIEQVVAEPAPTTDFLPKNCSASAAILTCSPPRLPLWAMAWK